MVEIVHEVVIGLVVLIVHVFGIVLVVEMVHVFNSACGYSNSACASASFNP